VERAGQRARPRRCCRRLPPREAATAPAPRPRRILRLLPRDLIGDGADRFERGADVFGSRTGRRRRRRRPHPPPPPPPPSAPPLPFTFIGKSLENGVWEVYLARGDRTYIVRRRPSSTAPTASTPSRRRS
jgi:hypothetical protein